MEIPDIESRGGGDGSKTNKRLIPLFTVIITIGLAYSIFGGFKFTKESKTTTTTAPTSDDKDYVDFAELAAITLNNISYTTQSQQRSDVAEILSDDLLTLYNKYFYDPDFLRLIADRKLYVTFQKIERSGVESRKDGQVAVKVIGFNTYHSDVTDTQAEYPFSLLIQVEKNDAGKMWITKLKRL